MNKPRYTYRDGLLEKGFYKAKELLKEGDRDEARDILDACIAIVAEVKYTNNKILYAFSFEPISSTKL